MGSIFVKNVNHVLDKLFSVNVIRTRVKAPLPYQLNDWTGKRLLYFYDLLNRTNSLKGDIVECGVGWGNSLVCITISHQVIQSTKKIWAFDSFSGLPEPSKEDEPMRPEVKIEKGDLAYTEAYVKARLKKASVPAELISDIEFIPGYFDKTLTQFPADRKVAFLHLDVDLYDSYITTLEFFYSRLVPGGIIALDEYNDKKWVGCTKAVDHFLTDKPERVEKSPFLNKYFIVKQ
ncbi:MAG: class I SAM-dependent methyltransferase [Cyclobacteriaceae bacterium]|nr:class I SAM-dependent methyltransferase [Cyclobacteriaceae bacterium]UYN85601.1 MAG: class I SAM-dependent methyltransferase [Cyclobacteriaceae bacterium]